MPRIATRSRSRPRSNHTGRTLTRVLLAFTALVAGCSAPATAPSAPVATPPPAVTSASFSDAGPLAIAAVEKLVLHDAKRSKDLSLRITYPIDQARHALIVWSHGAGGSKDNYQPLVTHWASHGFVVIQPTHSDSRSLGVRPGDPTRFLDWPSRPADVSFVLDSLDEVEKQVPALAGRIDRAAIGVGGHSFGANTAQLIGGAMAFPPPRRVARSYADPRVVAVMLLSGQGIGEMLRRESWQEFRRPMFVMTGSADGPTRTGQPAVWRKEPYELSPAGDKFIVWVEGLDHGYGGATGSDTGNPRLKPNADHIAWTKTVTVAYWQAYLEKNDGARAWLRSDAFATLTRGAGSVQHK